MKTDYSKMNTGVKKEQPKAEEPKVEEVVEKEEPKKKLSQIKEVVRVRVEVHTLNLRSKPNVSSKSQLYLYRGEVVEVKESVNDDWYAVETAKGKEGFIMKRFTEEI